MTTWRSDYHKHRDMPREPAKERGMSEPVHVWCCEKRHQCKWQCFALHRGLAWGRVEDALSAWRDAHDERCGGRLIQMVATEATPPGGDER